ncbi:MAG TPA: nucleotidyltransferase domain-containing protein [Anaerolineales bacterium]|nr:nucleotidyltransferase domain-containing protein [Anaerolineales bacterium]
MASPVLSNNLELVKKIVLEALQSYRVKVWLFGSQARGQARLHSDIDVAILPLEPLPEFVLPALREALEDSNSIYSVEIVNLSEVDEKFRQQVLKEGIPWKE